YNHAAFQRQIAGIKVIGFLQRVFGGVNNRQIVYGLLAAKTGTEGIVFRIACVVFQQVGITGEAARFKAAVIHIQQVMADTWGLKLNVVDLIDKYVLCVISTTFVAEFNRIVGLFV